MAIILVLLLIFLELNKNTVLGFMLAITLSAVACFYYLYFYEDKKKKRLTILCWVASLCLTVLFTWPPVKAVKAVDVRNPQKTEVVSIKNGDVQGVLTKDKKVEVFAGITYAKPPVGDLRWKEPVSPDNWDGVLLADEFAPMSMQPVNLPIYDSLVQIIGFHDYMISLKDNYRTPVSEDSLYVNVWRPAGAKNDDKLPVLVYVHGGSLKTGQPWYADYSGESLARDGVVVINMGYRLGVFGYFADEELANESANHTTGNYGLLDQIKALEWVKENVESFGGDPDNITVSGESAGAASVSAICVSPLAKGLFNRALLESSTVAPVSPTHSFRLLDEALDSGKELKSKYGVNSVSELRALSAKKIVKEADTQHHMTVDGYALEKTPYEYYMAGEYNEEVMIHGYNRRESESFLLFDNANLKNYEEKMRGYFNEYYDEAMALYPAKTDNEAKENWMEIWGAVFFDYPHYCLNRLEVKNGVPVYQYYFTKENGRLGPWHSGEEVYLYGNIPDGSKLYSEYDRELSGKMKGYFLNYIKTGNPNESDLLLWEENLKSEDVMEFGDNYSMIKEREHELFKLLDKMQGFKVD